MNREVIFDREVSHKRSDDSSNNIKENVVFGPILRSLCLNHRNHGETGCKLSSKLLKNVVFAINETLNNPRNHAV